MKFVFTTLFSLLFTLASLAQTPIGAAHLKNPTVYYGHGDKVFITGMQGMKISAACIDTDSSRVNQWTFDKSEERFATIFPLVSKNYFYLVEQASSRSENGLYNDLIITTWDGKNKPRRQSFRGTLFKSVVRYAIASDDDIYFLLDKATNGFYEEDIYNTGHFLMRYSAKEKRLSMINFGLTEKMGNEGTSFWFPLRIEKDFTEWYRTKVDNAQFIYEVKRLDRTGLVLSTKEIPSGISGKIPYTITEPGEMFSNVYYDYAVFARTDTATKIRSYSRLSFAPLKYVESVGRYYTATKVAANGDNGTQGIYLMLLDSGLNVLRSVEYPEMIRNIDLLKVVPKFSSCEYRLAFDAEANTYIDVSYLNARKKTIANKSHEIRFNVLKEAESPASFENLRSYFYPGFKMDADSRAKLKNLKADDLKSAWFLYTGKGMLYYLPSQKGDNVYFVKQS